MEFSEYTQLVANRFNGLQEDDKDVIRSLMGTSQGRVLSKVLGPEIMTNVNLGKAKKPVVKKRGLATR
tara:strand:- start:2806 stop:3009 length:204 start_codon:yes stop_codon:yes gene_type:complete